jgi:hypothetical protein
LDAFDSACDGDNNITEYPACAKANALALPTAPLPTTQIWNCFFIEVNEYKLN